MQRSELAVCQSRWTLLPPTLSNPSPVPLPSCSYWELCKDLLQPSELAWLKSCDNPPVKVMSIMSGLVKRQAWAGGRWAGY